eukprot:1441215-Ditylum_brightwellii.AAC.1
MPGGEKFARKSAFRHQGNFPDPLELSTYENIFQGINTKFLVNLFIRNSAQLNLHHVYIQDTPNS